MASPWPKKSPKSHQRLDLFSSSSIRVGTHLKDWRKRESFAMYAFGILGDGERKSAEPIAARTCADPSQTNNVHSKLCYFLGRSEWDDRAVRLEAARYAIDAVQKREPVTTWIVDDTGFLKQGSHSVGVQRQYTGSAGKVTNCQVGVSLAVATSSEQITDFQLYLPKNWATEAALRAKARIPDAVTFKTKIELAIEMIERAKLAEIPGNIVLADGVRRELGVQKREPVDGIRLRRWHPVEPARGATRSSGPSARGRDDRSGIGGCARSKSVPQSDLASWLEGKTDLALLLRAREDDA